MTLLKLFYSRICYLSIGYYDNYLNLEHRNDIPALTIYFYMEHSQIKNHKSCRKYLECFFQTYNL